jgi:hypothetical protein
LFLIKKQILIMKKTRIFVASALILACAGAFAAKKVISPVYYFGSDSQFHEAVGQNPNCPNRGAGCLILVNGQQVQAYAFNSAEGFYKIKP